MVTLDESASFPRWVSWAAPMFFNKSLVCSFSSFQEPRPGTPRSLTDALGEVVTRTMESMPENSTHLSSRLMAEETRLSQTASVRI
jgi:hypothetical protein